MPKLGNLHSSIHSDIVRSEIVKQGGYELILTGMKTHKSNIDLAFYGSCALEHLATDPNLREGMSANAGPLVLASMKQHLEDPDVQIGCMRLLESLAFNSKLRLLPLGLTFWYQPTDRSRSRSSL